MLRSIIYLCFPSWCVILELVPDASSKYFVYSLRKFISPRGFPGKILTDNGKVFTSQEAQKFTINGNIEWQSSLSNAPWYGAFWERLVSIVKHCIKNTVGKACLNFYELQIIWDRDDKFKTVKHVAWLRDVWNNDTKSHIICTQDIPEKVQLGK